MLSHYIAVKRVIKIYIHKEKKQSEAEDREQGGLVPMTTNIEKCTILYIAYIQIESNVNSKSLNC